MAGRRGNNEGMIRKRVDGRWEARITLPNGKHKCFYAKTREAVAKRLREALHETDRGLPQLDERQTVGQYMEAWYESIKPQLRGSSLRRYGDQVRLHVVPSLGKFPLARLTPQHVQVFYARKLASGLSSTTVHHIHGMFHRALEDALRMGLVQRNVTEMVRAPRRSSREMMTLSEEQARDFLRLVEGHSYKALYVLALTTGMREGELLGLRWQDIDFDRRVLQVRMNVQETEGPYILAETKTSYSRRNISLTRNAVEALRRHRAKQNEERLQMGSAWNSSLDLVFPNAWGGINNPDNFVKRFFKPLLAKAGLPARCASTTCGTLLRRCYSRAGSTPRW